MPDSSRIAVSVIYAGPERVFTAELSLPVGAMVADAIDASGVRTACPDAEIRDDSLGIFARKVSPDAALRDGDRVEIYRPLKLDPGEARRKRAKGLDH